MSKAGAARRLAAAAAYGGGGLGAVGASLYGVLRAEAALARRKIGKTVGQPPDPTGLYGAELPGRVITLAVLGDSSAAGYGATGPEETFGAFLAAGLSDLAGRPVLLESVAKVGAKTADLEGQIPRALVVAPDICAIMIGTNDVTHRVPPSASVRALRNAVETLLATGSEVVVGTCPDLGTVRPIAQPLRQVARQWSRRLAAAQTIATVEAGGRAVSLGSILGPEFDASPVDLFGPDRFHPSPAGYRSCAQAMLPTVAAAAGVGPDAVDVPEATRGEGVRSLALAAVEAAENAGTEVSRVDTEGTDLGPRGRWALLRHRRRHDAPVVGPIDDVAADRSRAGSDVAADTAAQLSAAAENWP